MLFFQQISILPHGCCWGIYTLSFKNFTLKSPSLSEFPITLQWGGYEYFLGPHILPCTPSLPNDSGNNSKHFLTALVHITKRFLSHGLKYSSYILAGFIVECIRRKSPTSVMWRAVTKPSRHQLNYHVMHSDTLEKNPINVINVIKLLLDMMTSSDITAFILVGTPCIITVQSVRFDT